jgi:folate-dependent phosphoribosylglycinamide formyltransferase PurN
LNVAQGHKGGTVKFIADSVSNGQLLAQAELAADEEKTEVEFTAPADNNTHDLYIVLNGDVELISWMVE